MQLTYGALHIFLGHRNIHCHVNNWDVPGLGLSKDSTCTGNMRKYGPVQHNLNHQCKAYSLGPRPKKTTNRSTKGLFSS